jgi:hypothetical protein
MKFLLIIQVCSALHMSCMNEMMVNEYPTHYDCATAGYLNAIGLTQKLGQEEVDRSRITVKFECRPVDLI